MSDHDFRDDDRFERVQSCTAYPAGAVLTRAKLLDDGYWGGHPSLRDANLWRCLSRETGPAILALPEEAPKPAAPSLDAVPVGSRWRWDRDVAEMFSGFAGNPAMTVTAVRADFNDVAVVDYRYDDPVDEEHVRTMEQFRSHATRIDEPAGAGTKACNAQWGFRYTCDLYAGHDGEHRDQVLERRAKAKPEMRQTTWDGKRLSTFDDGKTWVPTVPKPAMPPARCAPGCVPAKPCRIVIPVTDKGTRYECPAFAEENIAASNTFREAIAWPKEKAADQAEARAMRNQRWEPATPMVGRYVYDRRPR